MRPRVARGVDDAAPFDGRRDRSPASEEFVEQLMEGDSPRIAVHPATVTGSSGAPAIA
jgi:hypothetical protein